MSTTTPNVNGSNPSNVNGSKTGTNIGTSPPNPDATDTGTSPPNPDAKNTSNHEPNSGKQSADGVTQGGQSDSQGSGTQSTPVQIHAPNVMHTTLHNIIKNANSHIGSLKLPLIRSYLNEIESRDKICRAIQYGSKFISGGELGVAYDIDVSTGLARKVFRLLKSVNELEALSTTSGEGLPLKLLGNSKHLLMAIYFALDNLVWAGRMGIYKSKHHTDVLAKLSLYFFLGGSACDSLIELHRFVSHVGKYKHSVDDKKAVHRSARGFAKSSLDILVAIGLLQLANTRVSPRIIGASGLVSSLIACYELFRSTSHAEVSQKTHVN